MISRARRLVDRYRWSRSADANRGRAPLDVILSGFEGPVDLLRLLPPGPEPAAAASTPAGELNYLICYIPRSGSHHLADLLRGTGVAGKPADYLNLAHARVPAEREALVTRTGAHPAVEAKAIYGAASISEYLRAIAAVTRSPNGVFGLRVDLEDAAVLMRRGLFGSPDWNWRYVYLTRQDRVRQAISFAIAATVGAWSSDLPAASVELDEGVLAAHLLRLEEINARFECAFSLFGIQPLRITYEELDAAPRAIVERLLGFLGVPFSPDALTLESTYKRQRTDLNETWVERVRAATRARSTH